MFSYSKSTGGFYSEDLHSSVPSDAIAVDDATHAALMTAQAQGQSIIADANGAPIAVSRAAATPTPAQIEKSLTKVVQAYLDAQAQALGYDDIQSAVTYADEPSVPKFEAEGKALRAWRSQVWSQCLGILSAVNAGTAPVPTASQLIAQLPPFTAP